MKKLRRFIQSGFIGNVGKLMSGTGLAHLLGVAIIPIITRLYTPDQIGVYATYLSLFMILFSIASLRYEYATLIPKTDYEANNVTLLASFLAFTSSAILLLVLLFAGNALSNLLGIQSLGKLIYFLPVSVLSFSLFMIISFSLNRSRQYGSMAVGKICGTTGMATGQVGMGWMQFQEVGLVLGKVAGDLLGLVFLVWKRHKMQSSVFAGVSPRRMMVMAKRYRNFPFWNTPHALTTTTSNNIPVLLFNIYYSEAITGFYAMAIKALYSPVQVIAQAAFQVFSQRVAEEHANKSRLIPFMNQTLFFMGSIGFFPFLLLFLFSPSFFAWFLGPGYETTGHFVRILTPFIYLVFLVTPMNFIPLMLGRQRKAFIIDLVHLFLKLAALGTGIWFSSIQLALILYSAVGVSVCVYMLFWVYYMARAVEKGWNKNTMQA